jgi:DNA recombination protein RmuC
MSSFCDFNEQVNRDTDDGRLRPDMIVNLPDNKRIVIDSKVPLNKYLEGIESESDETRKQCFMEHAKAVERHVKNLSSKAYWSQFDNSVDFVVLYIEVEPAFGAALFENNQLLLDAIQNRIVFATPTTLITLLQTVAFSWKQHTATENAIQIWQSAKEIYERLAIFTEYIQKLGTDINSISKTYNQAVGSWESRVMPAIRKMENLGISSEKKTIQEIQPVESITREIK